MAVNTLVVIVLGLVMFSTGMYFLSTIMTNAEESINQVSEQRREEVLRSFPPGDELYIPSGTIEPEDGTASLIFGVYNRYGSNISVKATIQCVTCSDPDSMSFNYLETSIDQGDRRVLRGSVTNETWSDGQHVFELNVSNGTAGPVLGVKTFRVNG